MLDPRLVFAPLGDVLDRAFKAERRAVLRIDGTRVLRDPDDVAVSSVHLRLETCDRTARLDDPHELLATVRIHVELPADVVQRPDEIVGGLETVDVRQRRIGIQISSVHRRAEDSFDRIVKQSMIATLRLAQGLLGALALRDVLDESFHGHHPSVASRNAGAAFPHPANAAVCVQNPVFKIERAAIRERVQDRLAHPQSIVDEHDLLVRHGRIQQKRMRFASGDRPTAGADQLHRPGIIQPTAVHHAVDTGKQRGEQPRVVRRLVGRRARRDGF